MLNKENVGKAIAAYRKQQGLTQKQLADALHISYQAVSKWESGINLPTVEMLYDIAKQLQVSVDVLLNGGSMDNRWITYEDSGLNTERLYTAKEKIQQLTTEDERIVSAQYAQPLLFQMDTAGMKEPVYSLVNVVPGSKERYAREHGYDEEICADTAANGMNIMMQDGIKPVILQGRILCGNNSPEQLYRMASAFKKVCEENDVMFGGMEIGAQPVNYRADEYMVSAAILGVQDKENLWEASSAEEGDVLIGLHTEGINGINWPIVKVMIDRKPDMVYEKLEDDHYFVDEMMKANVCYVKVITELKKEECLRGAIYIRRRLLEPCFGLPEGLGACFNLSQFPILPLYRFLFEKDMIGKNVFQHHFHFGIGMVIAVPKEKCEQALSIIRKYHQCWCIGSIKNDKGHQGEKVWTEGSLQW